MPARQWWPAPTCVPAHQANVTWDHSRCHLCGGYHITMRAIREITPGEAPACERSRFILENQGDQARWAVSFDGGARAIGDPPVRVAGAGAILWNWSSPSDSIAEGEGWHILARATAELPGERWAPAAEAWGLRIALDLINQLDIAGEAVRITGDNLSVIRFGAGQGRLRRADMEALLSSAISTTLQLGWVPRWNAVPRRYNSEADAIATEALLRARTRFDTSTTPTITVQWRQNNTTTQFH